MNNKELWGWALLVTGVPGFLLFFVSVNAGLVALVLALIGGTVWYLILIRQPVFTILEVEKILTVHDADGHRASLQRNQKAKANHHGVTEFWCRNISADGSIENILIDNQLPHEQKKGAGEIQVCKHFAQALTRGQQFNTSLYYEMVDSFRSNPEILIHIVESKTRKVRLIVHLPQSRPCRSAKAFSCFGGHVCKILPPPNITDMGCKIEVILNKPEIGAEYCLEWDW